MRIMMRSENFSIYAVQFLDEENGSWVIVTVELEETETLAVFLSQAEASELAQIYGADRPDLKFRVVPYCASGYAEELTSGLVKVE